ncbi:MAG: nuclease-related domain-containing DEAD/DEAH box helicase, partial [Desulfomonilaceae bacterium]
MARMLPPVCPEKVSSSGERFLFQQLRDAPNSDSWCCLHSLELSRHVSKLCGEIDFVVAVPGE